MQGFRQRTEWMKMREAESRLSLFEWRERRWPPLSGLRADVVVGLREAKKCESTRKW